MLSQLIVHVNRIVSEMNGLALNDERYRCVKKSSPFLMTGLIWLRIGTHNRLL